VSNQLNFWFVAAISCAAVPSPMIRSSSFYQCSLTSAPNPPTTTLQMTDPHGCSHLRSIKSTSSPATQHHHRLLSGCIQRVRANAKQCHLVEVDEIQGARLPSTCHARQAHQRTHCCRMACDAAHRDTHALKRSLITSTYSHRHGLQDCDTVHCCVPCSCKSILGWPIAITQWQVSSWFFSD
jgi:hypothetical protein